MAKVGKNWRLGGRQLVGDEFAALDSKDFLLLRSLAANDSTSPLLFTFVGRKAECVEHAGLVALMEKRLHQSTAIFPEGSSEFEKIARLFPPVPPELAVGGAKPATKRG